MGQIATPLSTARSLDPMNSTHPLGRILVVEDDPTVQKALRRVFETEGYTVEVQGNGKSALESFQAAPPAIIILDLRLPQLSGSDLCREVKAQAPTLPIVVLSATSDVSDKVLLLELGADDYVTKPFSIHELQARVRAQLRRNTEANEELPQVIQAGDFLIDIPQHRVVVRGQDIHLTPKQFDLLVHLAQHPGQVLTHRALLHAVWGTNADQPEYLRVNIGQLRKKIERSEEPAYIVTEPWIGYRFRPTGNDDF